MIGVLVFAGIYLLLDGFGILPDHLGQWFLITLGLIFLARAVDLMFRARSKP